MVLQGRTNNNACSIKLTLCTITPGDTEIKVLIFNYKLSRFGITPSHANLLSDWPAGCARKEDGRYEERRSKEPITNYYLPTTSPLERRFLVEESLRF